MILNEFETPSNKFNKIQDILRENYNCEIATNKINSRQAKEFYEKTKNTLKTISEKEEPKKYAKLQLMSEGFKLLSDTNVLNEDIDDAVEEAKVIIAAQNMRDKLQDMVEDLAEMQIQDLMPIIDSMKEEIGPNEANRFNQTVDPALGELLDVAKQTKDKINDAIMIASGEKPVDMMSDDEREDDRDFSDREPRERKSGEEALDLDDIGDEFGGEDSAGGDIGPESRKMKTEDVDYLNALSEIKSKTKNGKVKRSVVEKYKRNK